MKTLEKNGEIKRASEQDTNSLIKEGWKYVPKSKAKGIKAIVEAKSEIVSEEKKVPYQKIKKS